MLRGKVDWQKCPTFTHIRENTPNKIACSKIEEEPLSESRESNSQQDYFLKNRRDTALRISRVRLPIGLLSQKLKRRRSLNLKNQIPIGLLVRKPKRHCSPNFESQISLDKAYLQSSHATSAFLIPQTTFSKRSDKVKTCEACNSHYIAMTKKGKGITLLLAQKSKRHRPPNLKSQTPNRITFSKIEEAPLSESQEPNTQQDCFLKNQRGTVHRISRARSRQDCLFENRRSIALRTSRARFS
ncbi:hypothetical protein EV1_006657 [Malus domestica]